MPPTFHVPANILQRHQVMEKLVCRLQLVRRARSIQRKELHSNGRSPVLDGLALFPLHSSLLQAGEFGDELMTHQYPAPPILARSSGTEERRRRVHVTETQTRGERKQGDGNGRVLTCASLGLFPIMQYLLQGREQLQSC